jgi:hypothetical protein
VVNPVEKFRQVDIHHIGLAAGDDLARRLHRLALVSPVAKTVTVRREQRLKDRF